jgi:hypothetical protein
MWFKNWHKRRSGRCNATEAYFSVRPTSERNGGVVLELRTSDLPKAGKRMVVVFPPQDAERLLTEVCRSHTARAETGSRDESADCPAVVE